MGDLPKFTLAEVERILAARKKWENYTPPVEAEPPEPAMPERYRLEWRQAVRPSADDQMELDEARRVMMERMLEYTSKSRRKHILLVRAQPGLGKTHAGTQLAQMVARDGNRVLYAMPTHKHFETISAMPHFTPSLWYHWLSLDAKSPETDNTMCIYPMEMREWTQKGYPAMDLCNSLCPMYKANCEYRRQKNRKEPIVAGTHEHTATGLGVSDFDIVIIDELPLKAFLAERRIPKNALRLDAAGPVEELGRALYNLWIERGSLSGKPLLDVIGPILGDVYAQFEDYGSALPLVPHVGKAGDVDKAPYWYLPDLLSLLASEYKMWQLGETNWMERVVMTNANLMLLKRSEPWDSLPSRMIVLDATGSSELYKSIFRRDVIEVAPVVKRKGRIFQVVNVLNGIGTFLEVVPGNQQNTERPRKRLARQGLDALALCRAIIAEKGYKTPGCVTFMDAVGEFRDVFGERTLHYYGQRGSNDLQTVDALFVVGCPQPPGQKVMEYTKALHPDRTRGFMVNDVDGKAAPIHSAQEVRYLIWRDGENGTEQAARMVSGFWHDPELATMEKTWREQELTQAIHRARPMTRDVDVWVLTSVPTDDQLDGIYDDPAEVFDAPEDFNWRGWVKAVEWGRRNPGKQISYQANEKAGTAGLDEITGICWERLRNQKWLKRLPEAHPELFEVSEIVTGHRPMAGAKTLKGTD